MLGWVIDGMTRAVATYGANVRLRGVLLSMGTNDALAGLGHLVGPAVSVLKDAITELAVRERWANSDLAFVAMLPDIRLSATTELREQITAARAGIAAVRGIRTYDPSSLTFTSSYPAAGVLPMGKELFAAYLGSAVNAVEPLFNPSRLHLTAALRLKNVPAEQNAQDLIDEGIQLAKSGFYRRLGAERIAAIRALPFTKNPTTANEHLRLLAATTEVKWVRMELLRIMPTSFMDGNVVDQQWQHEAAFRAASLQRNQQEAQQIRKDIDDAVAILAGLRDISSSSHGQVMAPAPDETPSRPGDTVRGGAF